MPLVSDLLRDYRADRALLVVVIARIDRCITLLLPVFGHLDAEAIARADVTAYLESRLKNGIQPQTVRRELTTLRAALRMAWFDEVIRRMPPIPLPPRGKPRQRVLSTDELERLVDAVQQHLRVEAFVRLLIATGGRLSAVCELTWDRVDLDRGIVDLRARHPRADRRKGRAVVPFGASVIAFLRAYRQREGEARKRNIRLSPDLVVGLSPSGARTALARIAASASIKRVTPHVFRHTVATHLLRADVPLSKVSRMLGHASIAVTHDTYGHLVPEDLSTAVSTLKRLAGHGEEDSATAVAAQIRVPTTNHDAHRPRKPRAAPVVRGEVDGSTSARAATTALAGVRHAASAAGVDWITL